jgi:PAS domain S-box-containing protein
MTLSIAAATLDQLNTLILVVNELGKIEYVSPSAKRILGYDPGSLLGEGWWDLTRKNRHERFVNKSEVMELLNRHANLQPLSFERALTTADGSVK